MTTPNPQQLGVQCNPAVGRNRTLAARTRTRSYSRHALGPRMLNENDTCVSTVTESPHWRRSREPGAQGVLPLQEFPD
jgi:hypothetical protein